tara:strand:- start:1561 stop:1785 length:225 start_codon:yes stop_codon:yes gene_type:complete
MKFSWENLKQNVKDNSPSSESVVKGVGAAVVVYAGVLCFHHRDRIMKWTKYKWSELTTKKVDGERESGQTNESV